VRLLEKYWFERASVLTIIEGPVTILAHADLRARTRILKGALRSIIDADDQSVDTKGAKERL